MIKEALKGKNSQRWRDQQEGKSRPVTKYKELPDLPSVLPSYLSLKQGLPTLKLQTSGSLSPFVNSSNISMKIINL
jgi:hypothetical protein